ncbi:hypothetical protein N9L68_03285 [bacterium]|nr:hypothetical protein [bacterium]
MAHHYNTNTYNSVINAEQYDLAADSSLQAIEEEAVESDGEPIGNLDEWLQKQKDAAEPVEDTEWQPATLTSSSSGPSAGTLPSSPPKPPRTWCPVAEVDSTQLKAIGFYPAWATLGDQVVQNDKGELYNNMAFPLSMLHKKGSAILLDTGSPTNLIGDKTSNLMELDAIENGRGVREWIDREQPLRVKGVGHGHQEAWQDAIHHIGLGGKYEATFKSPIMPDSELPGIWGGHRSTGH